MNENQKRVQETQAIWDQEAATFDEAPDHGLRDASVRAAWKALLKQHISHSHQQILDIGCGTGSLSLLLAELGFSVTASDVSPKMIEVAKQKSREAGQEITFLTGDAAFPQFLSQTFDAVVCRHLLWALPEPANVLSRWANLLKPAGQLLLIEGFWHTGAGLHAKDIVAMMPDSLSDIQVHHLSDQPELWGTTVHDERYLISAKLKQ